MFAPDDPRSLLLNALIDAPIAWLDSGQLAGAVGLDLLSTSLLIDELRETGWLDAWDHPLQPAYTLTPLAAEVLRVQLVPVRRCVVEAAEGMRWQSIDDTPPAHKDKERYILKHDGALDLALDPSPGPEAEAIAAESACWTDSLPRPSILLGSGLTPWPGPKPIKGAPCPGCHSQPIGSKAYCLVCDRWGLDHLLAHAGRAVRSGRPPKSPSEVAKDLGLAKATRKARRKAKLAG